MRRRLCLPLLLFSGLSAYAATIRCAWQNVPVTDDLGFVVSAFANSDSGSFIVQGFQLQVPCTMTGKFTVSVTTADTGGTTNKYAFGLYYNSGGNGTVGALYSTTGEFNGSVFGSVNTGVNITAQTTSECPRYPCRLPAGVYGIAMATDCLSPSGTCPSLGMTEAAGYFSLFSATGTGYSAGLPSTLSIAPIAPSPVPFVTQHAVCIFVW